MRKNKQALLLVYSNFEKDSRVRRHHEYLISASFNIEITNNKVVNNAYHNCFDTTFTFLNNIIC